MEELTPQESIKQLKKLPFSKSWQNAHVSKNKNIVNPETGVAESRELEDFLFIPAPTLVRHLSNDKNFLHFRNEAKNAAGWNFKLLPELVENNNRRGAILYIELILRPLEINFLVDDSFNFYISSEELLRISTSGIPGIKEFLLSLYIPKTLSRKLGVTETWGY